MALPTPLQKITYFFEQRASGWTENWYMQASSTDAALIAAKAVAAKRAQMLELHSSILAVRVTDPNVPGASEIDETGWKGDPTIFGGAAEPGFLSVLYRAFDRTNVFRRQLWIRGLPTSLVYIDSVTGLDVISPKLDQAVQAFIKVAVAQGFGMLVVAKPPPGNVGTIINNIQASTVAGYTTIQAPGAGVSLGQSVRIRHISYTNPQLLPRNFKPNGVWIAANVTPVGFDIAMQFPTIPPQCVYQFDGVVFGRTQQFVPLAGALQERIAERKTGRAFFVPRGRRSRRR